METKLLFLVNLFLLTLATAKPAIQSGRNVSCTIRQDVKCGERACQCETLLTFNPKTWYQYFLALVQRNTKMCKCSVLCSKEEALTCVHGKCIGHQKGCACDPCWEGQHCNQYKNAHQPKFTTSKLRLKVWHSTPLSQRIAHLLAKDGDKEKCTDDNSCKCAQMDFKIISGNDGTFKIEKDTGYLTLVQLPAKKQYQLDVSVQNPTIGIAKDNEEKKQKGSLLTVEVIIQGFQKEQVKRSRRSVTGVAHSLLLTMKPTLTKYYFDIGDTIYFSIIVYHNASTTKVKSDQTTIDITSKYLTLDYVSRLDPSALYNSHSKTADGLKIVLKSVDTTQSFSANVSGVVKNTIGPLSNLYLIANLTTTISGKLGYLYQQKSSPIVYAVFPTVNLTRDFGNEAGVYDNKTFNMKLRFPKLNYFLLAELTTNIEDFVFMSLKQVVVKNKGSAVTYNGTGNPVYHSSQNNHVKDRVVIDFGYLKCISHTNNELEIEFKMEVLDHPLLVNGSKHWMGVGLQAGYRVLWVEQQAMVIAKREPTLSLELSSPNISTVSRFYINDVITVTYKINHTNTSTADPHNIRMVCNLTNLKPNKNIQSNPNGNYDVTLAGNTVLNSPSLGTQGIGTFEVTVPQDVTPLVELGVQCNMTYTNVVSKVKRPSEAELKPAPLVGTPSIVLSLLHQSNNAVRPGEKRTFSLKILLTRMISPLVIELVMPTAHNESIFTIAAVNKAIIGMKITGYNASAVPVLNPGELYPEDHSTAVYDLGVASNINGNTNTADNIIQITFDVYVNDNKNIKPGQKFWVGAGVVGKPRMIWVGQIGLIPSFQGTPQPEFDVACTVVDKTPAFEGFEYNSVIKHSVLSQRWAYSLKLRFFLPKYIVFKSVVTKQKDVTHKIEDGSVVFETDSPLLFTEQLNITFDVNIDKSKAPHQGLVNVLVPVYVSFKDRNGKEYTVVRATHTTFNVPVTPPTLQRAGSLREYYGRGFFIQKKGSSYIIYVCIDQKFPSTQSACYQSEDKGATWQEIDNRVACVISVDNEGNLYGIARNKQAYMKFDKLIQGWVSVKNFVASTDGYRHSADQVTTQQPGNDRTIDGDIWGASKDGLHHKPSGGSWQLKARWL